MVINIDSSEQSIARLQLQPTSRCAGSASPDIWVGAPASPDLWVGGPASPDPWVGGPASPDLWGQAPPRPASGSGPPSRPTPQVRLLTKARTAANHYGPESATQG